MKCTKDILFILYTQNYSTDIVPLATYNLLQSSMDKCETDSEEVTCPVAANVFNGVEMALSVILVMADTINDERLSLFLEFGECFCEINR